MDPRIKKVLFLSGNEGKMLAKTGSAIFVILKLFFSAPCYYHVINLTTFFDQT